MKKLLTAILLTTLCSALPILAQSSFIRPLPPQIQSVDKNNNQIAVNFTATTSGVNDSFADFRYHAVLVNDLTVSLQQAYLNGRNANNGPMISCDTVNAASITLSVSKPSRYYLAISTSGMRKSSPVKERIYSGWKLYTSADSLPVQIMAGVDTTLYASAHFTGEDHSSAIAKITFATDKTVQKSFELKNSGVSFLSFPDIRDISSNGPVLVATSISEGVSGITSSIQTVVIKKDSADIVYYTVYTHITNMSTLPDLSYNIAIPAAPPAVPAKKVLAEGKIAIAPDKGLENILSTTTLLTRLPLVNGPDTINPLYQPPQESTTDSLQVKLLSAIFFHEAVAHSSPKAEDTEESAGIFTNYIQYFDNVVRNWGSVNDATVGLPRVRAICRIIKMHDFTTIVDSVNIINKGTVAEYLKPNKERKNYAFINGYSRLAIDLEKPAYLEGEHTGTAIIIRISPNISLYSANCKDTTDIFNNLIIEGSETNRRIIHSATDSLWNGIYKDGLWVNANYTENDTIFYLGINTIRALPRNEQKHLFNTPFSLTSEHLQFGDAIGVVKVNVENSLLQIKVLDEPDTLLNSKNPENFLHGQKRFVKYCKDYYSGDSLSFQISSGRNDISKIALGERIDTFTVILQDTSITYNEIKLYCKEYINSIPIRVLCVKNILSRRLCFTDAVRGRYAVVNSGLLSLNVENNPQHQISNSLSSRGEIVVRLYSGMKIFRSSETTNKQDQLLPDINNYFGCANALTNEYVIDWEKFRENFLQGGKVFLECKENCTQKLSVSFRHKKNLQEFLKEEVTIENVSVSVEPNFESYVGAEFGRQQFSLIIKQNDLGETSAPKVLSGTVKWSILEGADYGHFENGDDETEIESDNSTIWLVTGSTAGRGFKVKADVTEVSIDGQKYSLGNLNSESGRVTVVSAKPMRLTLGVDRQAIPFDRKSEANCNVTILDEYGNTFSGMPVRWIVTGDAEITYEENILTNGVARMRIRAGVHPSPVTVRVEVTSGNAFDFSEATIQPALFSLSISPDRYNLDITDGPNSSTYVRISAPGIADGTPVYWYTTNGVIQKTTIISSGSSSALLSVYNARIGVTLVGAKVGQRWVCTPKESSGDDHAIIAYAPSDRLQAYAVHPTLYADYDGASTNNPDLEIPITITDEGILFQPVNNYPSTRVLISGDPSEVLKVTGVNISGYTCPESDPDCQQFEDGITARIPTSSTNTIQLDSRGKGEIQVFSTNNSAPVMLPIPIKVVKLTSLTTPRQFEIPLRVVPGQLQTRAGNLWEGFFAGQGYGVEGFAGDFAANCILWGDVRDIGSGLFDYTKNGSLDNAKMGIAVFGLSCEVLELLGAPGILCNALSTVMKRVLNALPAGYLKNYFTEVFTEFSSKIVSLTSQGRFRDAAKELTLFQKQYQELLTKISNNEIDITTLNTIFDSPEYTKIIENVNKSLENTNSTYDITADALRVAGNFSTHAAKRYLEILGGISDKSVLLSIIGSKNNRALNAITTIASHEGIQPKSIARIINDQDIYNDKYTPVNFVASVERYFSRFPELTDEQYEKFFVWVGKDRKFTLERHHPLPKFLLGDENQVFVPLPRWWHQGEYHGLLGDILKSKGINYPTISSSPSIWEEEFIENPSLQLEAYDAVLEAARIMEVKYPPLNGFTSYIWESIVNNKFTQFF